MPVVRTNAAQLLIDEALRDEQHMLHITAIALKTALEEVERQASNLRHQDHPGAAMSKIASPIDGGKMALTISEIATASMFRKEPAVLVALQEFNDDVAEIVLCKEEAAELHAWLHIWLKLPNIPEPTIEMTREGLGSLLRTILGPMLSQGLQDQLTAELFEKVRNGTIR